MPLSAATQLTLAVPKTFYALERLNVLTAAPFCPSLHLVLRAFRQKLPN